MPMNIKGAIFDLDGTLLDSMFVWNTMGSDYLKSRGITPEPGLNEKFKTMSIVQAANYYRDNYGLTDSVQEIMDDVNRIIEGFYYEKAVIKPGVKEFLEKLKAAEIKMCVATATDRHLAEAALKRNEIFDYFIDIFTCTEVGAGKDSPVIFETARNRLGCLEDQTIVFEDAPHAIKTAKAAGFKTACVLDPSFESEWPDIIKAGNYIITEFNAFNISEII